MEISELRLVVVDAGRRWDVLLRARPGSTVGDLLAAMGAVGDAIVVDGRAVPLDRALRAAGLRDGVTIELGRDRVAPEPSRARRCLAVVGGLDAGRRVPLPPGTHHVGRSSAVAVGGPTVSAHHLTVVVAPDGSAEVVDAGSRNGTWLGGRPITARPVAVGPDDVVRAGALDLALRRSVGGYGARAAVPAEPGAAAVAHNRPPRDAPDPPPGPVVVPEPPEGAPPRTALSITAVVAPLVLAAVMVRVLGSPLFALFALLSPVLAIGSAVEQRRRGRRSGRRAAARHRAALTRLERELGAASAAELHRRARALPDLAEVARRAEQRDHLWERRAGDGDHLLLRAGTGTPRWLPPLEEPGHQRTPDVDAVLERCSALPDAPIELALGAGGVVGIAGEREAALAVARALVLQAAVHHGPADLSIAVLCAPRAVGDWDWAKWLPHARTAEGATLAAHPAAAEVVAHALTGHGRGAPRLVVVDDVRLLAGRRAPGRLLLRGGADAASGIVVAAEIGELPATCTSVIELQGSDGSATLHRPAVAEPPLELLVTGCAADVADAAARHLAGLDDPELPAGAAGLPASVRLLELLDVADDLEAWVAAAWRTPRPGAPVALGADAHGPVELDLAVDGPHALVAGTTGAGKSELLRSLVAGLALGASPAELTFVLVDFKGGAAFDACARLPHVVGLVTDLDEHLAARALRCLEAELRHRERILRACGAADLAAHRAVAGAEPMPRLVIVVDELATLRAEVPDFVESLVGIAQRGRSLGMHLVLATQKPAGTVSDQVRANTALRIALRVHDGADSVDVVGVPVAADLPRAVPGRAVARLGPGELLTLQVATVGLPRRSGARPPVAVSPFAFGAGAAPPAPEADAHGISDLDAIVDACAAVFAASGASPPRRPWTEPLPGDVELGDLPLGAPTEVVFALADDPDRQRRHPHAWRLDGGNLVVAGAVGSGVSTALASIGIALARAAGPDDLHLYVLAAGGGHLDALAGLPHCGAVVAGEREREARLLRTLRAELDARLRAAPAARRTMPRVVVLVDGYGAFAADRNDLAALAAPEALARLHAEGPGVGIHLVIGADRFSAVPAAIGSTTAQRLLLRLADRHEHAMAGWSGPAPGLGDGRGLDVASGLEVQVARPAAGFGAAAATVAAAWPAPRRPPARIGVLPTVVGLADVVGGARLGPGPWWLPIGVGERLLEPVGLSLHGGDLAVVAGPARSGRTTALRAVASAFAAASARTCAGGSMLVLAPRSATAVLPPSGGAEVRAVVAADAGELARLVREHRGCGPLLLVVDDAELVDDPAGELAALAGAVPASAALVVAGRNDALRSGYGSWTRALRRARTGLLLRPDPDLDGELVGTAVPRRAPVALGVGRGWLCVDGDAEVAHLAC